MSVMQRCRELVDEIKNAPELQAYESAFRNVMSREAAKIMLRDFRKRAAEIDKAAAAGEDIGARVADLRRSYEIIVFNPYIRDFFEAERRLAALQAAVHAAIADAFRLPGVEELDDEGDGEKPRPEPGPSNTAAEDRAEGAGSTETS